MNKKIKYYILLGILLISLVINYHITLGFILGYIFYIIYQKILILRIDYIIKANKVDIIIYLINLFGLILLAIPLLISMLYPQIFHWLGVFMGLVFDKLFIYINSFIGVSYD